MPGWYHESLKELEDALVDISTSKENEKDVHSSRLLYPLAVVYSLMFKMNLVRSDFDRTTKQSHLSFNFEDVIETSGRNSAQAHEFYDRGIYLAGEKAWPFDMGWLNMYVANLRVITQDGNAHTYRKVPQKSKLSQ